MDYFYLVTCILFLSIVCLFVFHFCFCFGIVWFLETIRIVKRKKISRIQQSSNIENSFFHVFYNGIYRYVVWQTSHMLFMNARVFIYKHFLKVSVGKKVVFHQGTTIVGGYGITIGDGTIIGDNVVLDGRGGLNIGKNVNFSSNASIYTAQHDLNDLKFCGVSKSVCVGDRAWISTNCIILPGVCIGNGTVVAAGAVVTKDLPDFTLCGGVPAKPIARRNKAVDYEFDGKSCILF